MESNDTASITQALTLLDQVQSHLDHVALAIAQRCAQGARLDDTRLEAHQAHSYELAWANAEQQAAVQLCRAHATGDPLNQGLSLVYAVDTLQANLARLRALYTDLGLEAAELLALDHAPDLRTLAARVACAPRRSALGAQVVEDSARVGQVPLDPDVVMVQEAFRRFAEDRIRPRAEEIHRDDLDVPDDVLAGMSEMGAFGLSIPETYGGSASDSPNDLPIMLAVTETLSEASLGMAGSLLTRPEILARALLEGGTDEQKAHWLPRMASGESLCAIAITEPDYGSDVAQLTLKAQKTTEGWRLDGAKTWCTFAGKAQLLMVVARTESQPGHKGLSLFLVPKPSFPGHAFEHTQATGGTLSGRAIRTIGYRGMHSFDLHFNHYLVPDSHLIGQDQGRGKGFVYTMAGMTGGRMQTAARAAGVMKAALHEAILHSTNRKLFGRRLADHELTQVKLCNMAALYSACRTLCYHTAQDLHTGGNPMQASLVKLLACRAAERITREAQQLHGGLGYAEETPVSRLFVDARVLSIFEGAEETLALKVIARSLYASALAAHAPRESA